MESNPEGRPDPASARHALEAIGADRERLAERFRAQSPWTIPAQALAVALLVASPAAGVPMMSVLAAVAVGGLLLIDALVRRRTGIHVTRPAGPRGVAVLAGICVVMVSLYITSVVFFFGGDTSRIAVTTAAAFVLVLLGGLLYDRVYVQEVRRAG